MTNLALYRRGAANALIALATLALTACAPRVLPPPAEVIPPAAVAFDDPWQLARQAADAAPTQAVQHWFDALNGFMHTGQIGAAQGAIAQLRNAPRANFPSRRASFARD